MTAIEQAAQRRYVQGLEQGLSASPWTDPDRDLAGEAGEELEDAFNYLRWEQDRALAGGRVPDHRLTAALHEVITAHRLLAEYRAGLAPGRAEKPGEARDRAGEGVPCLK
jgi:hypothetical protein